MLCFVNDLLDLKQIKNGVFQTRNSLFDPNEVLMLIEDMFSYQAKGKSIDLVVKVVEKTLPRLIESERD